MSVEVNIPQEFQVRRFLLLSLSPLIYLSCSLLPPPLVKNFKKLVVSFQSIQQVYTGDAAIEALKAMGFELAMRAHENSASGLRGFSPDPSQIPCTIVMLSGLKNRGLPSLSCHCVYDILLSILETVQVRSSFKYTFFQLTKCILHTVLIKSR